MGEVIGTGIGLLVIGLILYGLFDAARGMFRKEAPAASVSQAQALIQAKERPRAHLPGYDAKPDEVVEVALEPLPDPERGALGGGEGVWARIMRLGEGSVQIELEALPESIEEVASDGPVYRKAAAIFPTTLGSAEPLIEALCALIGAPAPLDAGIPHEVDEDGDAEINAQVLCYGPALDLTGRIWRLYGVALDNVPLMHFRVDAQAERAQWLAPEVDPREREAMAAMLAMRLRGVDPYKQHTAEGLPSWGTRREALLRADEVDDIDEISVVVRGGQVFVGYNEADSVEGRVVVWSREGGARALLSLPEGVQLLGLDACARGERGVCVGYDEEERPMLLWLDLRQGAILQQVMLPEEGGDYQGAVVMRPDGQQAALSWRGDDEEGARVEILNHAGTSLGRSEALPELRPFRWDAEGIWSSCEPEANATARLARWRLGERMAVRAPGVAYAPPEAPRTRYHKHQLVFERDDAPPTALPYGSADDYAWWSLSSDYEPDVLPWLDAHIVVMDGFPIRLIDTRTGRAIATIAQDDDDIMIQGGGDGLLVMERLPDEDEGDDVVLCVIALDELADYRPDASSELSRAPLPDGASW